MAKPVKVSSATFVCSVPDHTQGPKDRKPEYAFIGRSNVGKSSLVNMLTNNGKLAHVSSTPGKTRTLNYFLINESWYLVDLPGYGYARRSKEERGEFSQMMIEYFSQRESLTCVMVLVDARIEPQDSDLELIEWLGEEGIPFVIVFTKADLKLKSKTGTMIASFKKELLKNWEELPPLFYTSTEDKIGRDELLKYIEEVNKELKNGGKKDSNK
ncbi:MAG: ribosome biogenesis GTP-binding protein YihA/YsxC [Cytophagaceae bacterium]|jgi:GTP-binding protein|nr:ribosome biogenesis GTP-binding protein YihA/YsxC [Cytophagaceae bacterium]